MKKTFFKLSFMTSLLLFSIVIVTLMFLAGLWTSRELKNRYTGFSEQLEQIAEIYNVTQRMSDMTSMVSDYISSDSMVYKEQYQESILNTLSVVATYKKSNRPDYSAFRDLDNMLHSYHEKALDAIISHENGVAAIYVNAKVADLARLQRYVDQQINLVVGQKLEETRKADQSIKGALQEGERDFQSTSLILLLFCFAMAIIFSRVITKPVTVLTGRLQEVGNGNFAVSPVELKGNGEIRVLSESFNFLISRLQENLKAIQEKNEMAEALKESKIHGLELENSNKQAHLDFLQSQINPHFLYNTLNSMITLADLEGAGKTRNMLLRLNHLMQYNLKSIRRIVSVGEELDLVSSYMQIQEIRFGGRIRYVIEANEEARKAQMPGMILQPLVENAVVHGLEPLEEGGLVRVTANIRDYAILLTIVDNGLGMKPETLSKLQPDASVEDSEEDQEVTPLSESNSGNRIGLHNVVQRLSLMYGGTPLQITSTYMEGTTITITIPISRKTESFSDSVRTVNQIF